MKVVGFFKTYDHPTEGGIRLTAPPMKFSETPAEIRQLPAQLGEHSVEVLREAGYSEAHIAGMVKEGSSIDGRVEAEQPASLAAS
jgi:formyl-CoA transferase